MLNDIYEILIIWHPPGNSPAGVFSVLKVQRIALTAYFYYDIRLKYCELLLSAKS